MKVSLTVPTPIQMKVNMVKMIADVINITFAPCTLTTGPCTCGVLLLSISRKYSTCTHGGGHWLQLGLVMLSFSHWREYSLRWWWCHLLQLVLGSFSFHLLTHILHLRSRNFTVWWWSVMVVCIYIYNIIYIYMYIIIFNNKLLYWTVKWPRKAYMCLSVS